MGWGDGAYGDGAEDAGLELVLVVGEGLASVELGATVGELDHDGGVELLGRLEDGVDARRRDAVDGGDRVALLLGGREQVLHGLAGEHTRLDRVRQLREVLAAAAHAEHRRREDRGRRGRSHEG